MLNKIATMAFVSGLAVITSVQAAPVYSITDLGVLAAGDSRALAINNSGLVVGESTANGNVNHAFLWSSSAGMQDISLSLGSDHYSVAYDINNLGQVVGRSYGNSGIGAFFWSETTGMQSLAMLTGTSKSIAYGINNAGMIVGQSDLTNNRGFLWNPATGFHDVTTPTGYSYAYAVNAFGVVAGATFPDGYPRPAIWSVGLGSVDLVESSGEARDINDSFQVVGWSGVKAFIWDPNNGLRPLDGVQRANAINSSGTVVGVGAGGAILWDSDNGFHDLNNLIDPALGWRLYEATGINDSGQIVGTGINPQGISRAFLLTPVPEPATYILLLAGLGLVGWAGRRRKQAAQLSASVS